MVGSALTRQLSVQGHTLVTANRSELDLTQHQQVSRFFADHDIDHVYLAAAKVGGIGANNTFPAEFIHQNLTIQNNVIHAAWQHKIKRLLFLGSSCIYPRLAEQPMREEALLSGHLEPTNEPYAIAKIAGIKMCESYNRQYGCDFRSVMPTNLYGPGDNFHPTNSHVMPALMRRIHEAKINNSPSVVVWGSGKPKREFLHVDDMASACIHVMSLDKQLLEQHTQPMQSHINVGTGIDCSIAELTNALRTAIGYEGSILYDRHKPDGTPRKLLNVDRLCKLGWQASISLENGLKETYNWFLNQEQIRN